MPFRPEEHEDPDDLEEHEQRVEVDVTLEDDIAFVEQTVAAYLEHQDEGRLSDLRSALERLDAQTDLSDAWTLQLARQARFGATPTSTVIGQAGFVAHAEELPSSELDGQITLVKAAKDVVRHPDTQTLAVLTTAQTALDAFRAHS